MKKSFSGGPCFTEDPFVFYFSGTSDYEKCYLANKLNLIGNSPCGLSVDKVCFSFGFLKYCE